MQNFVQLLRESAAFTLTREHWRNSTTLIVIIVVLLVAGHELDRVFDSSAFSDVIAVINFYLTTVIFSIAWYRAVVTTGTVVMDYRFTRRTWCYLFGCLQLTLIIVVIVIALVIVAIAAFGSDFYKMENPTPLTMQIGIWIVLLPVMYLLIRLEFILAAAANDSPMTLGHAWDSSGLIQGPLVGAVLVIQGLGGAAGYLLPDPEDPEMASIAYLIEAINMIGMLIVQAFVIAATGIAYKTSRESLA